MNTAGLLASPGSIFFTESTSGKTFSLSNIDRHEYTKASVFQATLWCDGFPRAGQRKTKGQPDGQLTQEKGGGTASHSSFVDPSLERGEMKGKKTFLPWVPARSKAVRRSTVKDTASLLACPYSDAEESWPVWAQNGRNLTLVSYNEKSSPSRYKTRS